MAQYTTTEVIFNSRKYLLEILEEQGYNVSEYNDFSIHEIHAMYLSKQLDLIVSKENPTKKIYIKYHLGKTLRQNNIYEYIEDLFNLENILNKCDDLIIIIKDEPNETLIRMLKDIWESERIFIRIFNIKRLQFNILKHSLVPKHIILNDEEIKEFKKQYNLKDHIGTSIPDISRFSPVGLAIGIRPGNICKIERTSKTAVNSLYYRICI